MKFNICKYTQLNSDKIKGMDIDKQVIIPVGIPGSGKTTIRNQHIALISNLIIVSPDEVRKELLNSDETGIYYDEAYEEKVWKKVIYLFHRALESNYPIFFDATNIRRSERRRLIKIARKYHYSITVCRVKTPFWLAWYWNNHRKAIVPNDVMQYMRTKIQEPKKDEYDLYYSVKPDYSFKDFIRYFFYKYLKKKKY